MNRQKGQATLLALGLSLVCFAVAGLALDGARAWILRRTLQNAVDAAALSAAGTLDTDAYYRSGGDARRLDVSRARRDAESILALRGLSGRLEISAGAHSVRARLRARLSTTTLSLVGIRELNVAAEATARPLFSGP